MAVLCNILRNILLFKSIEALELKCREIDDDVDINVDYLVVNGDGKEVELKVEYDVDYDNGISVSRYGKT